MLQRNTSGYSLSVPSLDLGADVPTDGEIEHDELLAGFAPVEPATKPPADVKPTSTAPDPAPTTPEPVAPIRGSVTTTAPEA